MHTEIMPLLRTPITFFYAGDSVELEGNGFKFR